MQYIKLFFLFLIVFILSAFYWAYYISNFHEFSIDVQVKQEWINTEEQLFDLYTINKSDEKDSEVDLMANETWSYFFSDQVDETLTIEKTVPDNKDNILPISANIEILFSNYAKLESLLWYVKWTWETLTCPSWSVVKVVSWFSRCPDLNKVYLYKEWGQRKIFSWIIKRWDDDNKSVELQPIPSLDASIPYILEIEPWISLLSDSSVRTEDYKLVRFLVSDSDISLGVWTWSTSTWSLWTWSLLWTWGVAWTWEVLFKSEENWTWSSVSTWSLIWTWELAWTWSDIIWPKLPDNIMTWSWLVDFMNSLTWSTLSWSVLWTWAVNSWTVLDPESWTGELNN